MKWWNNLKKKTAPAREIQIGDKYVDKTWGDTIIEVVQISTDRTKIRYKFTQIDGQVCSSSSIHETSYHFIYTEKILIE